MKMSAIPFSAIDWSAVPPERHPGETGFAVWRTVRAGDIRVRMVEYSPGYKADHWCSKGHIILVLEGELVSEQRDGSVARLRPGMGYHVADDTVPHRSSTEAGAKLFIVD